ncbi:hypothetical protein [Rahnella sp. PD12R]|nr:hypothetical protein [Rahnella sp. PD12R]
MISKKWRRALSLPVAAHLAVITGGFLLRVAVVLGLLWWPGGMLF